MDHDEIQELLSRIDTDNPPTDDALREVRAALRQDVDDALDPEDGVDLKAARQLSKTIKTIDAELEDRRVAREEERAEADKLLAELDDGDQAAGTVDEEPEASDDDESDDDEAEQAVEQREPVAAAASLDISELRRARTRIAARRAARRDMIAEYEAIPPVEVVLSGPVAGEREPQDFAAAVDLFQRKNHLVTRGKQTLIELQWRYPRSRTFGEDAGVNTRTAERLMNPRAIVAAGGICDPLPADFSHPICGDRFRPIRDALPRFGADRGGVRFAPAATLGDVAAGVGTWTEATDASPGTATKDPLVVNCEAEVEVKVDAIYRAMQVGNFQARFNPEFWQSRLDLLLVAHERHAEQKLFTEMVANSTAVNALAIGTDTNTANRLFVNLAKAVSALKSRHRLRGTRFVFIAPAWLREAISASIARNVTAESVDALALADATIAQQFSKLMIDPVWSEDLNPFGAQSAGNLLNWPNSAEADTLLFPQGTFMFLDGGTLDLGIEIADSTLNQTNDRQAFAESFEQVALRGCESYALSIPVAEDCICGTDITG